MSNFKIQKVNDSLAIQIKQISLSKVPNILLPSKITLLNYSLDQLTSIFASFFEDEQPDRTTITRVLTIIGCSLADTKLTASIEKMLSQYFEQESRKVYSLIILWTTTHFQVSDLLLKLTSSFRKSLIIFIFQQFLLATAIREGGVLSQLGAILSLTDSKHVLNEMKKKYIEKGSPLKVAVGKCMLVRTQNKQLKQFIQNWATYCISVKPERLLEFTIHQNRKELEYLIENVPSMSGHFINQLKQTIDEDNIGKLCSPNSKINIILQTAIKQWINQKNNYWKVVNRQFTVKFGEDAWKTVEYAKLLNRQQISNECLSIKLLYSYFQSQYFNFQAGDALVFKQEKEQWIDCYRSISHTTSYKLLNLCVLNKNVGPSWWQQTDPRKASYNNKNIKKLIEKYSDFLEGQQKYYSSKNKKISVAYNVLIVFDKEANKQYKVTFQQLAKMVQNEKVNYDYRDELPPFKTQPKKAQQIKKDHNIIIEAKIVRILKRSKEGLSVQAISKQSKYDKETVELAMKRLVSKNLADQDANGLYKYDI